MRLFVCMTIANMSDEFSRSGKGRLAILAPMRPDPSVSIHMVLEGSNCLESSFADTTFMGPFFRVRLHMSRQQIPFVTSVGTVVAVMCIPRTGRSWWGHNLRLLSTWTSRFFRTFFRGRRLRIWIRFKLLFIFIIAINVSQSIGLIASRWINWKIQKRLVQSKFRWTI